MHQFNERHPAFKGFSKFYEDEIRPYQAEVTGKIWRLGRFALIISGLALLCMLLGLLFFIFQLSFILSLIGSAGFLGLCFLIYDMNKYPLDLYTDYDLIVKVASYANFYSIIEASPPLLLWRSLGLIPYSDSRNETLCNISREYKGLKLKLVHIKIYVPNETDEVFMHASEQLAFDGHLIRLDMPKSFSGITVVARYQGLGQAKTHTGLKRVGLVDPVFEKIFEVYGSDQVESRALLSPDLMQEMVDLERVTRGKSIEFGFIAGQLLIKLSRPNLDIREALESGEYNKLATQNLIDEISSVFDIVDIIAR